MQKLISIYPIHAPAQTIPTTNTRTHARTHARTRTHGATRAHTHTLTLTSYKSYEIGCVRPNTSAPTHRRPGARPQTARTSKRWRVRTIPSRNGCVSACVCLCFMCMRARCVCACACKFLKIFVACHLVFIFGLVFLTLTSSSTRLDQDLDPGNAECKQATACKQC